MRHIITISIMLLSGAATALAEGGTVAQAQQPPALVSIIPMVILLVIFYFLLIRPQQKRVKKHREMVAKLQEGDKVITTSGIHGTIKSLGDGTVVVSVAENVNITMSREAVSVNKRDL